MFRVGVTGGIGCGKSVAARSFEKLGIPVIDADTLAREVVAPGQPALKEILAKMGKDLALADGQLDRARLRQRVFASPPMRLRLEAIVHPRIAQAMEDRIETLPAGHPYVVLVIPLLVEAGWSSRVDRILVIDCPEPVQVERVMARDGVDAATAWAMVRSQASREERLKSADDIIENGAGTTLGEIATQVRSLDCLYRGLSGNRAEP